jgi:hypothetical protein
VVTIFSAISNRDFRSVACPGANLGKRVQDAAFVNVADMSIEYQLRSGGGDATFDYLTSQL